MMAGVFLRLFEHSLCKTGCTSKFLRSAAQGLSCTYMLKWSQSSFLFCSSKWEYCARNISTINTASESSLSEVREKNVGITAEEQKTLLRQRPVYKANMKLLKVAIIGAPNAGKSTLLNHLINWKVSPVSEKVHTTRCKTVGILTEEEKQIVFLDTPGIVTPAKAKRHNLEISLLLDPHIALAEADLVVVVVDVSRIWNRSRLDPEILKLLHLHSQTSSVLVLNKVDLIKPKDVLLAVVRNLTDGVVCQRKDWTTMKAKRKNRLRIEDVLNKIDDASASCATAACHSDVRVDGSDASAETMFSTFERDVAVRAQSGRDAISFDAAGDENDDISPSASADVAVGTDRDSRIARLTHRGTNDLRIPEVWTAYYKRLSDIGQRVQDEKGWRNFDAVFMVSAVDGDGVDDLKNYLLDGAYPAPWIYHSSVVTDQNPVKLARLVVRECLLNHLPDEIPYSVHVKLSLWEIGEDNYLRAAFDIHCNESRHASILLGKQGQTLRAIAAEAKQQLMNVFHREMSLKLTVRTSGGRVSKLKTSAGDAESGTRLLQKHSNL